MSFSPTRSLLNPKFEGYKLDLIPQHSAVSSTVLPYPLSQAIVPISSRAPPLSFQDVQSRITHNHLAVAPHDGQDGTCGPALYVDAAHRVVVVDFDIDPDVAEDVHTNASSSAASAMPTFRAIYELPRNITPPMSGSGGIDSGSTNEGMLNEYPSAAFVHRTLALVADGGGLLYALDLAGTQQAELLACFKLSNVPDANAAATPFRILSVTQTSPSSAVIVFSSRSPCASSTSTSSLSPGYSTRSHSNATEFDVWAARLVLPIISTPNIVQPLNILWHRRGADVPLYVTYAPPLHAHAVVGSAPYRDALASVQPAYEPTPDEIAPIPRAGETLDSDAAVQQQQARPPPYTWTQTPDAVTLAFALPRSTQTADIRVVFSPRTLTVHVRDGSDNGTSSSSLPPPHYTMRELWDGIQPATSLWTWDREGSYAYGLLTVHLDKQHEGTRWMQVFASQGQDGADADAEVPETLDPSELYAIREAMEKFTSGEDSGGFGMGQGVSSLATGEMDDEVDSSVGRTVELTWIDSDGATPSWVSGETPFTVLSTPLPGAQQGSSLVIKHGIDGPLFELDFSSTDAVGKWRHAATFSALAFVLASKRDTRFTHHVGGSAVLAFESGSRDRGGNLYLYRSAARGGQWAKQSILKVGDGPAGALLGVGLIWTVQRRQLILCLCENELVVIHGVL